MDTKLTYKPKRAYYTGLFILFGLFIALCTSVVNYRLEVKSLQTELMKRADGVFTAKLDELEGYTAGLRNYVIALRDSSLLFEYLVNPTEKSYGNVTKLFFSVASSNSALMQVRFIDLNGDEKIRIDWLFGRNRPSVVAGARLQNKRHRYYFIEASQTAPLTFWYSKLDLNMENLQIEIPYKPVLRIASPVFVNQQFKGIVIINVHIKNLLNKLQANELFQISIADRDGFFLVHFNKEYSWSRYLETGHALSTEYPLLAKMINQKTQDAVIEQYDDFYVASLANIFVKDKAIMILRAKRASLKKMEADRRKAALLIILLILVLSVPLALVISRKPAELYRKIANQNRTLTEYLDLIDKNLHTCTVDENRVIIQVSTAFTDVIGIPKTKIKGMSFDQLCGSVACEDFYEKIWQSVKSGDKWIGEICHSLEDGTHYLADTVIYPKWDEAGVFVGYSVFYQDITDKKRIEILSITDELTGLYNRRYFNTVIEKELNRALRDGKMIAFAMLDVDYFKLYNDHYGHQKGDKVLHDIGRVLKQKLARGGDYSFRLGGEEFGILFNNLSPIEALDFTENVRKSIEKVGVEHKWSQVSDVVTVSVGLLSVTPGVGIDVDTVYKLADQALYKAKELGRNQVIPQILDPKV